MVHQNIYDAALQSYADWKCQTLVPSHSKNLSDFSYVPAINPWNIMNFVFFLSYSHISSPVHFTCYQSLLKPAPLPWLNHHCHMSFLSPHVPLIPSNHSSNNSKYFIIVQILLYSPPSWDHIHWLLIILQTNQNPYQWSLDPIGLRPASLGLWFIAFSEFAYSVCLRTFAGSSLFREYSSVPCNYFFIQSTPTNSSLKKIVSYFLGLHLRYYLCSGFLLAASGLSGCYLCRLLVAVASCCCGSCLRWACLRAWALDTQAQ